MHKKTQGFSIIELSVVIVIIGLLLIVVISGRSLLESAQIQKSVSLFQRLDTYVTNFKSIYEYLPGDMPNASTYWGDASNGNGNGQVSCAANGDECWKTWQHLDEKHAGIAAGTYNGTNQSPDFFDYKIKLQHLSWLSSYYGRNNFNGWHKANNASGVTAQALDLKMDDGIPNKGKIFTYAQNSCVKQSNGSTDATSGYTAMGKYNSAITTNICSLWMITETQF